MRVVYLATVGCSVARHGVVGSSGRDASLVVSPAPNPVPGVCGAPVRVRRAAADGLGADRRHRDHFRRGGRSAPPAPSPGPARVVAQLGFWVVLPLWVRRGAPPTSARKAAACRPGLHCGASWEHTRHVDPQNRASLAVRSVHRPRYRDAAQPIGHPRSGAEPTVAALRRPAGAVRRARFRQIPRRLARITPPFRSSGGLLLATGKLPRIASAALAFTVIPGSLGGHLFWTEATRQRKARETPRPADRSESAGRAHHRGGRHRGQAVTGMAWPAGGRPDFRDGDLSHTAGGIRRLGVRFRIGRPNRTRSARRCRAQPGTGQRGRRTKRTAWSRLPANAVRNWPAQLPSGARNWLTPPPSEASPRQVQEGRASAARWPIRRERANWPRQSANAVASWRQGSRAWQRMGRHRSRTRQRMGRHRSTGQRVATAGRGSEWADIARERGAELGERAYERGSELADTARERGGELAHRGRVKARHWH